MLFRCLQSTGKDCSSFWSTRNNTTDALVLSDSSRDVCVCACILAELRQQVKAHDSASFNMYVCTMSVRIVSDRLDHISTMRAARASCPPDALKQVGSPTVFERFKLAHCIDEQLVPKTFALFVLP